MEPDNEQLWEVVLEMDKSEGYCQKGQEIREVVWAIDSNDAIDRACKFNEISRDNVIEKGTRLWEDK